MLVDVVKPHILLGVVITHLSLPYNTTCTIASGKFAESSPVTFKTHTQDLLAIVILHNPRALRWRALSI